MWINFDKLALIFKQLDGKIKKDVVNKELEDLNKSVMIDTK